MDSVKVINRLPMTLGLILLFAFAIGGWDAHGDDQKQGIETIAWMAGSWSNLTDSTASEEIWMPPRGGTMVGMNRDTRPGRKPFFEFLRIDEREDGVFYIASPRGAAPTEFRMIEANADSVVFANPEHDFPQRIIYRRIAPDTLGARVEGTVNGELVGSDWQWSRTIQSGEVYNARERGLNRER
jgi:hypothetical protein